MILAIDTETTGVDLHHGARPYIVTTCDDSGNQLYWVWDINPVTRIPIIPPEDLVEIQQLIDSADELVGQNIKFDVHALRTVIPNLEWDWSKTHDTLVAAHILESNGAKDLTSLGIKYLSGVRDSQGNPFQDIQKYEDAVERAVDECRKVAKKYFPTWRIAHKTLEEMPSAKEKVWKFDMWLPREIAKRNKYPPNHPYWTVTTDYANKDTETTLAVWYVERDLLKRGGLL